MQTPQGKLIAVLMVAVVASSFAAPAAAQTREGFYLSGGIGWGYYYQRCGGCVYANNSADNYVYYLGVGTTVKPNMRVGFQADIFNQTKNSVTQNLVFYNLVASLYPKPASNMWVKFGLGWADNKVASASASGLSFMVGLGIDITPGKGKLALIPYVNYDYQFGGGATSGSTATNVKASLLQFGIGIGLKH